MDYISRYHQTYLKENKYDEFISKGTGFQTINFILSHEFMILYARGLRFYLYKLKQMGIKNEVFEKDFTEILSSAILNVEYTPQQVIEFSSKLYDEMLQAKEMYILICEKNNLKVELHRVKLKDPRTLSFPEIIKIGEKIFDEKYKRFSVTQMNFVSLFMNNLKSDTIYFLELKTFGIHDDIFYDYMTYRFSIRPMVKHKEIMEVIKTFAEISNHLLLKIHKVKKERYGEITPTEISMSVRPNKAILVTGSNLAELEMLLEATKNRGIDIYTHGNMLSAHIYPKFKSYPHFVGHFSKELESYFVDFSNFPGSILLTKHSLLNVKNFYQGRLYTTDFLSPDNVCLIKDYNFEPLIQSALHSEGFIEPLQKPPINFNFSEKKLVDEITEVSEKIKKGEIKHFFAIGVPNQKMQKEYFDEFLGLLGDDCYVLSFSNFIHENEVFPVEPDYFFPFLYKTFDILTEKINISKLNPIILLTRCETHTFSNLTYMLQMGIKKIYLIDCPSNLVNPSFLEFLKDEYDVKGYTNPENDLKEMLKK